MTKHLTILVLLSSMSLYALINVLLKIAHRDVPPFATMAISMLVLGTGALLLSCVFEPGSIRTLLQHRSAGLLLFTIGIVNLLAFWLLLRGLPHLPIWQTQLMYFFLPIFGSLFAFFLLGEKVTWNTLAALVLMSGGLFIAVR